MKRRLLSKSSYLALPFWYDKQHTSLFFKRYREESEVPLPYRKNIIRVKKSLYRYEYDCNCKALSYEKKITVQFEEPWSPYNISPKQKEYKRYVLKCAIPQLTFYFNYHEIITPIDPRELLENDSFPALRFHIEGQSLFFDQPGDFKTSSFFWHDFKFLEFAVCYFSILSCVQPVLGGILGHAELAQSMLGPKADYTCLNIDIRYLSTKILDAIVEYKNHFPYCPAVYLKNINSYLRTTVRNAQSQIDAINSRLPIYDQEPKK